MITVPAQPGIRLLNLHNTPFSRQADLRRVLTACSRNFTTVSADLLEEYCQTGRWSGEKPGLVIAFYNGYRNNYDVAAQLLDELGLIGWFFVATDFVALPAAEQPEFCRTHTMRGLAGEYPDDRLALSPEQLLLLSRRHEVCSHTASHRIVFSDQSEPAELHREIVGSAQALAGWTGKRPAGFCWLGGEQSDQCPATHPYLATAGYRFLFGSRSIEYLPIPGL
jgi:peptidoglycan/xylan/chitin deacetylase (PgdA/CDA1 family)